MLCKIVCVSSRYGFFDIYANQINDNDIAGTINIGYLIPKNENNAAIRTTNDMPVVEPESLSSFNLVPFQINPHYLDANPAGHAGETREDRIKEFIQVNRDIWVVGLREGTMLLIEKESIQLIGKRNARIFRYGNDAAELSPDDNLNFLLQ